MVLEIWRSFRAMPAWVQIWVGLILVPVNVTSLAFVLVPGGLLVAVLANVAMLLNLPIMVVERGLSKAMALPHVLIWSPLVVWLGWILVNSTISGGFGRYILVLLAVDVVSLVFDFKDARDWFKGQRTVAGR